MFSFFRKKKVDWNKVKEFDGAVKAIKLFIVLSEWDKARKALKEIEYKEKDSLNQLLEDLDKTDDRNGINEREKIRLTDELKKKQKILDKITEELEKKEDKHKQALEHERFKIRFKKIKDEIQALTWNKKDDQALGLLQKFLEEHPEKREVQKFHKAQKKKILKSKDKNSQELEQKVKQNAQLEAMSLIWETANGVKEKEQEEEKKLWFFGKFKAKINFYNKIKERIRKKKLLDEINLLIEEDSKVKNDIAARKLANIHKWLVKELSSNKILWYELYGKILWADKISGDTFGYTETDTKYNFFLWDATGHGIRAWFIITLLTRLYNKYVKNSTLWELTYEINNGLKQDLKSRNFITWIFFQILKADTSVLEFVWMWHEPILIYRKKTAEVERVIPGGLAAWIRMINKPTDIKLKTVNLEDGDTLITYSDWIVENKSEAGEFYGLDRLEKAFQTICQSTDEIHKLYEYIINDVKIFRWGSQFDDDASVMILRRDLKKDLVDESSDYLEKLKAKEWLNSTDVRKLKWKTVEDIDKELEVLKKKKETQRIIKTLEALYYTWEILKLKQEAIRYIKEWYIDKKINFYLRKAIDKEKSYKIEQKNQKVASKYHILEELLKKWDFETVISEAEEIISKDWNI